jgi:predicted metal-binding membrane protein
MTSAATPPPTATLARPPVVPLLAAAAVAWVATIAWARDMDMGAEPGTMGLGLAAFVALWALMMAAMMLPSVWPFVTTYGRTVQTRRPARLTALASGYLATWAAAGVVGFAVAWTFGELAESRPGLAQATAVVTFAACGAYQLTPLKFRCLQHCRSPITHLFHYLGLTGPFRDVEAGARHGLFCLGCCWSLMVLLVAFGVMNLPAMVGLAVVIGVEKTWRRGAGFARVVGVACLLYAVALAVEPGLAPGLDPGRTGGSGDMGTEPMPM